MYLLISSFVIPNADGTLISASRISCLIPFEIDDITVKEIETDVGVKFKSKTFLLTRSYDNSKKWSASFVSNKDFIDNKVKELGLKDEKLIEDLSKVENASECDAFITEYSTKDNEEIEAIQSINKYFINTNNWSNYVDEYITVNYLVPHLPRFMYYDDYYMLPSRVSLDGIASGAAATDSDKTAKALLELADVEVSKVVNATNYEATDISGFVRLNMVSWQHYYIYLYEKS